MPLHCEVLCTPSIYTPCCAFSSLLPYSLFKFSLCRAHILKAFSTPSPWSPSLLRAPVSFSFFLLALFSFHTIVIVILGVFFFRTMGYSHLLSSDASLATFWAAYGIDIPKDLPSNRETSLPSILSTSRGTIDYAWIRLRRHTGHLRLTSSNRPTWGIKLCPWGGAIVLGPWAR